MVHSALYILFIISLVHGVPDSYLDSLSSFGGWLSYSANSESETEGKSEIDKIDDPVRRVVDESDKDIEAINPDKPIHVDDFVEGFKQNVQNINTNEKDERVSVLKQLRTAVYDDSLKKVKVFYKGFWHLVDLGIVGSSQRKRSAEKTEGVFQAIANVFKQFNRAFWRFLGYPDEEDEKQVSLVMVTEYDGDEEDKDGKSEKDKDKDKNGSDKDKNKEGKDGADRNKKPAVEKDKEPMKDSDSDDESSDKKGKSDVVLKPLVKSEDQIPKAHTSANGRLTFDTNGREGIGSAMKSLAQLSSLLGNKLTTREEVDKELKEAQDKNDENNRYVVQVNSAKKLMKHIGIEEGLVPEAEAKKKLDEMEKDFDKTTDKTSMVKDIRRLCFQPLYYIETYDRMMDFIDRLRESGVPENDLKVARDGVFEQKLFSLTHSIQQTPKKEYQSQRREKQIEAAKKERKLHKDDREWTEQAVTERIKEIEENYEKPEKKADILKDLTSMSMQPLLNTDLYDKMYALMEKMRKEGKASEEELEPMENALKQRSRFSYFDSILDNSEVQNVEKYKLQSQKAKEKRDKQKDTRKFTEEQALKQIDDMNKNFDSKDPSEMTKDVTSLSMQPFYRVETYDKVSDLIGKLKTKGVADDVLKPAIDSLAEERAFSSEHDPGKKPQGSVPEKLEKLKEKYIKPEPLNATQKQELFQKLQKLRENGQKQFTKDGIDLVKRLMGDPAALEPSKVSDLYSFVNENQMDPNSTPVKHKINPSLTPMKTISSADLKGVSLSNFNVGEFKPAKLTADGKVVPA